MLTAMLDDDEALFGSTKADAGTQMALSKRKERFDFIMDCLVFEICALGNHNEKEDFQIFIAGFVCPSCGLTYGTSYVAANRFSSGRLCVISHGKP